MWDALQPAAQWLGDSMLGQWLGQSALRIAALFVMHLAGLTLLLGGTFVICLRLFGIGFPSGSQAQLTRDVAPWRNSGLALMLWFGVGVAGRAIAFF